MDTQEKGPGKKKLSEILKELVQPFIDLLHTPRALLGLNISYVLEGITYFGVVGLALTELRPKGIAGFAGSRLDVVADGNYVRQGSSIEVTRIEDGEVYVHEIPSPKHPTRK